MTDEPISHRSKRTALQQDARDELWALIETELADLMQSHPDFALRWEELKAKATAREPET